VIVMMDHLVLGNCFVALLFPRMAAPVFEVRTSRAWGVDTEERQQAFEAAAMAPWALRLRAAAH
jgi:hypothetical protein